MSVPQMRTVHVHLSVMEIGNVNSADGTAEIEVCAHCIWHDASFQAASGRERWRPKIFIFNSKAGMTEKVMMDRVSSTGICMYNVRFAGKVSARFDLRTFPFDTCRLRIKFELLGQDTSEAKLCWCAKDADLASIVEGKKPIYGYNVAGKWFSSHWTPSIDFPDPKGALERITISGWSLRKIELKSATVAYPQVGSFDLLELKCDLHRMAFFYLAKVFFLIVIIASCSIQVFHIPLAAYGNRATVLTSCMGGEAAMMWIFRDSVPKMNYLTVADKFIQLTFVYLACVLLACIWVNRAYKKDQVESALAMNRLASLLLPTLYLLTLTAITAFPLCRHVRIFRSTKPLPSYVKRKRDCLVDIAKSRQLTDGSEYA